jgi:hypothetical protein
MDGFPISLSRGTSAQLRTRVAATLLVSACGSNVEIPGSGTDEASVSESGPDHTATGLTTAVETTSGAGSETTAEGTSSGGNDLCGDGIVQEDEQCEPTVSPDGDSCEGCRYPPGYQFWSENLGLSHLFSGGVDVGPARVSDRGLASLDGVVLVVRTDDNEDVAVAALDLETGSVHWEDVADGTGEAMSTPDFLEYDDAARFAITDGSARLCAAGKLFQIGDMRRPWFRCYSPDGATLADLDSDTGPPGNVEIWSAIFLGDEFLVFGAEEGTGGFAAAVSPAGEGAVSLAVRHDDPTFRAGDATLFGDGYALVAVVNRLPLGNTGQARA